MNSLACILAAALLAGGATAASEPTMARVPSGPYQPFVRTGRERKTITVPSFELDRHSVTNAEFLEFVRRHPKWRRSQVKRLFADDGYLSHWTGDLDLGTAKPGQPVTRISWFAAKAYADSQGKRLPTTVEWEVTASAGFTERDGKKDPAFIAELAQWYSEPTPDSLPDADSARDNFYGVRGMHGLIWEWTSDFNATLMTGDARGDSATDRDLFCGAGSLGAGDNYDYPAFMRFGLRGSLKASYTVHNLGFRCARDL